MPSKMMSQLIKYASIAGLLLCFVLVRFYESSLFYDPLLQYFKADFNKLPMPEFSGFRLFVNLLFRYGLNMLISLALIYVIFRDKMMIQFSFFLYSIAFIVLSIAFFIVIHFYGSQSNFLLFYLRRFLIQPIFILFFIPAFYFQKRNS